MTCTCKREQIGPLYYHTRCWFHRFTHWLDLLFLPPVWAAWVDRSPDEQTKTLGDRIRDKR